VSRSSRRSKDGRCAEPFARIPDSVMRSDAVKTLNHAAFKVLAILALQYRASNNGTLALTEAYARDFGLSGRDTLYRSLRELKDRGLIVQTREGFKSKTMFTLWALGWEAITHRDGKPLDVPEPKNHRWQAWTMPEKPKKRTHRRGKAAPMIGTDGKPTSDPKRAQSVSHSAEVQTDSRECSVPTIGKDEAVSVPIVFDRSPISVPTNGNTSRVWGGVPFVAPPAAGAACARTATAG
jgi:hypothetical protein